MSAALKTILALAAVGAVHAAVTPTAPGPGDSFNEGQACNIRYTVDSTGTWKNMTIELMTGSNTAMVHVADVATGIDGTTGDGTYSWTCPDVTPNSAIYFYQFTNSGADATWTTRFTIAGADGSTTTPTESTQPNGQAIPWGTGRLASGSSGSAGASGASSGSGAAATGASSGSSALASSSGTGTSRVNSTASASGSSNAAAATPVSQGFSSRSSASGTSTSSAATSSSSSDTSSSTSGAEKMVASVVAAVAGVVGVASLLM